MRRVNKNKNKLLSMLSLLCPSGSHKLGRIKPYTRNPQCHPEVCKFFPGQRAGFGCILLPAEACLDHPCWKQLSLDLPSFVDISPLSSIFMTSVHGSVTLWEQVGRLKKMVVQQSPG